MPSAARRWAIPFVLLALAGCSSPSSAHDEAPGGSPSEETSNDVDSGREGEGDPPLPISRDAGDQGDAAASSETAPSDAPTGAGPSGAALIDEEANRQLAAMISSTYQHTTHVDEAKGIFDYDCSGFVGYDLSRAVPDGFATLKSATVARPLAEDFEHFFAEISSTRGRWRRVSRALDLVPGDIVAWLQPAEIASANTGHVMIVHGKPEKNPKREGEVLVPIVDATSSPHGPADSRAATGATGLGTGTIGLFVDAKGAPVRYRWTGGYSSSEYTTAIALGHAD
jgi:hypothetical protein